MRYGISYIDSNTTIPGLIIFDEKQDALLYYNKLKDLNTSYKEDWIDYNTYLRILKDIFNVAYDVVNLIPYRDISKIAKELYEDEEVEVVNSHFIEIY